MAAVAGIMTCLAVRGPQDFYMLDNGGHTFWKTTYPRHTNAQQGELYMPFQSNVGWGRSRQRAKIERQGDLLGAMFVKTELPAIEYNAGCDSECGWNKYRAHYAPAIGYTEFENIDLQIGGHPFDRQYGDLLYALEQIMTPQDRYPGELVGDFGPDSSDEEYEIAALNDQVLFTPLKFWFNRFPEQSLPMIALYWHDVQLEVSMRRQSELVVYVDVDANGDGKGLHSPVKPSQMVSENGGPVSSLFNISGPSEVSLVCVFTYLDKRERSMFANGKHEYIFDQIQHLGPESHSDSQTGIVNHNIRFNHPNQEIFWFCRRDAVITGGENDDVPLNQWTDFSGVPAIKNPVAGFDRNDLPARDPFISATMVVNGQDRTIDHPAIWYRAAVPYMCHTRIPHGAYVYAEAIALKPEALLDTDSINMSRLDSCVLKVRYPSIRPDSASSSLYFSGDVNWKGNTYIFGRNKNIGKVSLGMFGLRYAA